MAFRLVLLCAIFAFASAGNLFAPAAVSYTAAVPLSYSAPAITSQSSNIYRSAGNLGQISTYSKSIDTPFSSVRKSDVRISNPGLKFSAAPAIAYSTPAVAQVSHIAPAYAPAVAQVSHIAPAYAPAAYSAPAPLLGVAYSAAPAVAHVAFDSGIAHYSF